MRQLVTLALLVVFSAPSFQLFAIENPESKLPACCRRDGKHGCGMAMAQKKRLAAPGSGHYLAANTAPCSSYPRGNAAPRLSPVAAAPPAATTLPVPETTRIAASQPHAFQQASRSGTRPQRGPPGQRSSPPFN